MIDFDVYKFFAAREAGQVKRFHTFPTLTQQTVGEHTFNMLCMLFQIYDEVKKETPSINLIKAVMYHDFGERWVGDVPATARWHNEEFKSVVDGYEEKLRHKMGFYVELTEEETRVLKFLDSLDCLLWAVHEENVGNKYASEIQKRCLVALDQFSEYRDFVTLLLGFSVSAGRTLDELVLEKEKNNGNT